MQNDFFLHLRDGQAGDVDIAVKAQRDLAVGPQQPLARDRPPWQGFKDFDEHQVRWLDDIIGHRYLLEFAGNIAACDLLFGRLDRLAPACGAHGQCQQPAGPADISCAIHAPLPPGTPRPAEQAAEVSDKSNRRDPSRPVQLAVQAILSPVHLPSSPRGRPVSAGSVLTRLTIGTIPRLLKSKTRGFSLLCRLGEITRLPLEMRLGT